MRIIIGLKDIFLIGFFLIFILATCETINFASAGDVKMNHSDFDTIPSEKWETLSAKKIFFGHHSVGENIISGMEEVSRDSTTIDLKIIQTKDASTLGSGGFFAHGETGHNFDPASKITSFKQVLENGMGNKVDIAFMKFCFVDIGTETDFATLFQQYKKTMDLLKKEFPHVTFVHVTVPLYVEPQGIKSSVKQKIKMLLGKNDFYENTAKAKYNRLLRAEYAGKEPLFDLASFESTYPDGRRLLHKDGDLDYESLIPEYSSDGGHLNKQGQEVVSKALLAFLASLN